MAKTIKSLLRISMMIRNLGTLNNYTLAKRMFQSSAVCSSNKDSLISARPHLVIHDPPQTALKDAFQSCKDVSAVLDVVQKYSKHMSISDVVTAMHILFTLEKAGERKTYRLYERPEFMTLCEITKRNARKLSPSQALAIFKTLIYLEVPTSSIIVQVVLQILRENINHLSLNKIGLLYYLICRDEVEDTPLLNAIKMALPIVYENSVLTKLDRDSPRSIVSALRFMSEQKNKNYSVIDSLLDMVDNFKQPIHQDMAVDILLSLCELRNNSDVCVRIFCNVQNALAQNIATLGQPTIKRLLTSIALATKRFPRRRIYHEGFADACASIVISEDWGFSDAVLVSYMLQRIAHVQIPLLDYIAAKCFEDPTILEPSRFFEITKFVSACAHADYKPVFWETIQEAMSDLLLNAIPPNYAVSRLVIELMTLDYYCPKLVEMAFDPKEKRYVLQRYNRLLLYQAVKTLYPQYSGPLPDESTFEFWAHRKKQFASNLPLLKPLECGLGGSRYVLTNARTKLHHQIDHVVVMRKGGFPVPINDDDSTQSDEFPTVTIDDLQPPPDGQVLLIRFVPFKGWAANTERMVGTRYLSVKTLEALTGYTVISISQPMWERLAPAEQIPYLMQAIRLKCDDVSISANV